MAKTSRRDFPRDHRGNRGVSHVRGDPSVSKVRKRVRVARLTSSEAPGRAGSGNAAGDINVRVIEEPDGVGLKGFGEENCQSTKGGSFV
jgi:hypothetical protein